MKEKINRGVTFVKKHKLPILVITGVAVGVVIGYQYYNHKALMPHEALPGYLKINLSPEQLQWMREEGGKYVHGSYDLGIFETSMAVPPGM